MEFDDDIPMPNKSNSRNKAEDYKKMKVGQSFIWHGKSDSEATAYNSMYIMARRNFPDRKFMARKVVENGQQVVRVWRVK